MTVYDVIGKYAPDKLQQKPWPRNKYADRCCKCKEFVPARAGFYYGSSVDKVLNRWGEWTDRHRHLVICDGCLATETFEGDKALAEQLVKENRQGIDWSKVPEQMSPDEIPLFREKAFSE